MAKRKTLLDDPVAFRAFVDAYEAVVEPMTLVKRSQTTCRAVIEQIMRGKVSPDVEKSVTIVRGEHAVLDQPATDVLKYLKIILARVERVHGEQDKPQE